MSDVNNVLSENPSMTFEEMEEDLKIIGDYYAAMEFEHRLLPISPLAELPTLVALLEADDSDQARVITHNFIPLDNEQADMAKFLQFYSELSIPVEGIDRLTLLEGMCALNKILIMGHCDLQDPRPELAHPAKISLRTVQGYVIDEPIDQRAFIETLYLFDFNCDIAHAFFLALAAGKTVEQAFASMEQG